MPEPPVVLLSCKTNSPVFPPCCYVLCPCLCCLYVCVHVTAQVSEKILLLDAEAKELRLAAAAADDRAEVLAREKAQVMSLAEELRADAAAKMALLDEFEARFARQYRCEC